MNCLTIFVNSNHHWNSKLVCSQNKERNQWKKDKYRYWYQTYILSEMKLTRTEEHIEKTL